MLVPPPHELDLRVPKRVVHLRLDLVARARSAPSRALLEVDDGLGARRFVRDGEVADDFEVLGSRDEVSAERRRDEELAFGHEGGDVKAEGRRKGRKAYTKEEGFLMLYVSFVSLNVTLYSPCMNTSCEREGQGRTGGQPDRNIK